MRQLNRMLPWILSGAWFAGINLSVAASNHDDWIGIGVVQLGEQIRASSERGGRIVSIDVQVGQAVQAKQRLYTLDRSSAQMDVNASRAQLNEARASLAATEIDVQRAAAQIKRQLAAPQLFSAAATESAELDLRARQAQLAAARARVDELTARVSQSDSQLAVLDARAERSGTVVKILRSVGEQVQAGETVLRLESSGAAQVRFAVPPAVAAELAVGAQLQALDSAGATASATLSHIAPQVDAPSGLIFVHAQLATRQWPTGTPVEVRLAGPDHP